MPLLLPVGLFSGTAAISLGIDPSLGNTFDLSSGAMLAVQIGPGSGILFYLFLRVGPGEKPDLRLSMFSYPVLGSSGILQRCLILLPLAFVLR